MNAASLLRWFQRQTFLLPREQFILPVEKSISGLASIKHLCAFRGCLDWRQSSFSSAWDKMDIWPARWLAQRDPTSGSQQPSILVCFLNTYVCNCLVCTCLNDVCVPGASRGQKRANVQKLCKPSRGWQKSRTSAKTAISPALMLALDWCLHIQDGMRAGN